MPYIQVQYSASVEHLFDIRALLSDVHDAASASGLFEIAAIRSVAQRHELLVMGDGSPENGFVLIVVRMRRGRAEDARQDLARSILRVASRHLEPAFDGRSMALNVEIQEIISIGERRHALTEASSGRV